jgi:hypothetical protein
MIVPYRFTAVRGPGDRVDHTVTTVTDGSAGLPETSSTMSLIHGIRSPFSEIRDADRQITLLVIATSALATCGTAIAGMLVVLGAGA